MDRLEPTNVLIASTSTIDACCQKHKDKIKANGGIVSYKGGIHEMDGTRTNRRAPATKCCGSTISLDVGGDSGAWWRAAGAFVRRTDGRSGTRRIRSVSVWRGHPRTQSPWPVLAP